MAQKPTPELTDLTLEAFRALEAEGRIHQISLPLTVSVPFGPAGNITAAVQQVARSHGAHAYMTGDALQIEAGLVVPVTLYTLTSQSVAQAAETQERSPALQPEPRVYTEPYVLRNIRCIGSDGNVFEEYAELRVQADVVRQGTSHRSFTPYQAIVHFESQQRGQFSPSMALSCNVLVALFRAAVRKNEDGTYTTIDAHAKQILDQYKDYGSGYGWHAQNTVVNWQNPGERRRTKSEIIHYPTKDDFPEHGGDQEINTQRPKITKEFDRKGFKDCMFEDACQKPNMLAYLQDFTGLQNPAELGWVATYYGRTAKVWISSENKTRAAWLGCYGINDDLILDAFSYLYYGDAARGVAS